MTSQDTMASDITTDELAKVSRTKVFFGHQSVGMNVLSGVPGVYAAHHMAAPTIEQDGTRPDADGGFIGHAFIGENEKPLLKIQDFDAKMRSGIGQQVDVAMMKLCYIDITSDTDVGALFATYRETIAALERDFPKVTFVHVTVPLMTEQGPLSKLKSRLTGSSRYGPRRQRGPRTAERLDPPRVCGRPPLRPGGGRVHRAGRQSRCRHVPRAAVLPAVRRLRITTPDTSMARAPESPPPHG